MKKRILATLILALSLSFTLCACGSDDKSSKKSSKKSESSKDDDDYDTKNNSKKDKKSKADDEDKKKKVEEEPAVEEEAAAVEEDGESLEDFIYSDIMQNTLDQINKTLVPQGLSCAFEADGPNTLVLVYTFNDQLDLGGASKSDLAAAFDKEIAPMFEEQGLAMADELAGYGITLKTVRVVICNADGTELYEKDYNV